MPQCVSEMVQVSNFYLQRGAAKILNKALLKFGRKTIQLTAGYKIHHQINSPQNLLWLDLTQNAEYTTSSAAHRTFFG